MASSHRYFAGALLAACWLGFAPPVTATGTDPASEARARDYFTNLEVISQDGDRMRFYDDVLRGKVVVLNFIFTNCQGACPMMTRNLTLVRDMLGDAVGNDIHFVSISLDPVRDTPAAMKAFARTHDADQQGCSSPGSRRIWSTSCPPWDSTRTIWRPTRPCCWRPTSAPRTGPRSRRPCRPTASRNACGF